MTRIIRGVMDFQRRVFGTKKELFDQLDKGQRPQALFITCSDSRINPNLLTQTDPGELFILRNAGNLVPPYPTPGGEGATIEYAVEALEVRDVILCGHSSCGAMQGLLAPQHLENLPLVAQWLEHARPLLPELEAHADLPPEQQLLLAIERNVLLQLEHLRQYPAIADRVRDGRLRLHGWVYHLGCGEVTAYDPLLDQFTPLGHLWSTKLRENRQSTQIMPADAFHRSI